MFRKLPQGPIIILIKKKLCYKPLLHPKLQRGPHTSMEEKKIAASAAVNWMSERGIECALLIIEVWSPKPGGSVPTKKNVVKKIIHTYTTCQHLYQIKAKSWVTNFSSSWTLGNNMN